ncbi:MAG: hypothetical protein ACTSQJ_16160, partial [Promethearchaeota archaeon]
RSYSIARLIENIRRYSIGDYNDIFEAWIQGTQITGLNFWLRFLYYFIAWIGITIMFFNIERHIFKKNKYFLTIVSAVEGTVSIINYFIFNIITFWMASLLFFVVMFMPLLFLNLARKTPSGPIRNACVFIAIGIMLFAIGVMIDLPEMAYFLYINNQPRPEQLIRIIAPIIIICGIIMLSIGFKTFFPKE